MAIIRSRRLFAAVVQATPPGSPEFVWTCPAGQRAILREVTCHRMGSIEIDKFPTWYVVLRTGGVNYYVYSFIFGNTGSSQNVLTIPEANQWDAMHVCHPGDQIGIQTADIPGGVHVTGNGHQLPE